MMKRLERIRERLAIWIAPWIVYDDVKHYYRTLKVLDKDWADEWDNLPSA